MKVAFTHIHWIERSAQMAETIKEIAGTRSLRQQSADIANMAGGTQPIGVP